MICNHQSDLTFISNSRPSDEKSDLHLKSGCLEACDHGFGHTKNDGWYIFQMALYTGDWLATFYLFEQRIYPQRQMSTALFMREPLLLCSWPPYSSIDINTRAYVIWRQCPNNVYVVTNHSTAQVTSPDCIIFMQFCARVFRLDLSTVWHKTKQCELSITYIVFGSDKQ